jgi:hypothetical protein
MVVLSPERALTSEGSWQNMYLCQPPAPLRIRWTNICCAEHGAGSGQNLLWEVKSEATFGELLQGYLQHMQELDESDSESESV